MKIYLAFKEGDPVLEFRLEAGQLVSAGRFDAPPPAHPFLSVRALEPGVEDEVARIVDASRDGDDFVRRLEAAGYAIEARP